MLNLDVLFWKGSLPHLIYAGGRVTSHFYIRVLVGYGIRVLLDGYQNYTFDEGECRSLA